MLRPKLDTINLGEVYAENEVLYLDDYEKYFYDIGGCIEKIKSRKKFVVVGRKGTGKTLLANVVCKRNRNIFAIAEVESLKDFVFHELVHFGGHDISSTKYVPIFEWMIFINVAKHIVLNHSAFDEEKVSILKKFLLFFGHVSGDLKIEKTIEMTRALDDASGLSFKLFNFGGSVTNKDITTVKQGQRSYLENLENLKSFVIDILNSQEKESIVFYDELDDKFVDDDNYKNAIISFLGALSRTNDRLIKQGSKLKVCAVIRRDIIDLLHSPNINRILEDNAIYLDWQAQDIKGTELFEMLAHKIRISCNEYKNKSTEQILSAVMAEKIAGEYFNFYLIHRTLGRPRDLIRMLTLVIEEYGSSLDRFEGFALSERLPSYSAYLKREISSELSGHINSKDIDAMFDLLQLHGRRAFTYKSIQAVYDRNKFQERNLNLDLDQMLSALFDVGAIGNYIERTKAQGGNVYYWTYNHMDLKVKYDFQFEIHPGLWDSLRIAKPKNRL